MPTLLANSDTLIFDRTHSTLICSDKFILLPLLYTQSYGLAVDIPLLGVSVYAVTYQLICHDIALVQQFCDWVLVMYKGRIVEEGVPDEVIRKPQNDYTKRLIESIL